MNKYEQYIFDLNGYLVIEDILTTDQVAALNEALDRNLRQIGPKPASTEAWSSSAGGMVDAHSAGNSSAIYL